MWQADVAPLPAHLQYRLSRKMKYAGAAYRKMCFRLSSAANSAAASRWRSSAAATSDSTKMPGWGGVQGWGGWQRRAGMGGAETPGIWHHRLGECFSSLPLPLAAPALLGASCAPTQ